MKKTLLVFTLIFTSISCSQNKIPKGDISDNSILFEYAIYFLDDNTLDLEKTKKIISKDFNINIIDSLPSPESVKGKQVAITYVTDVKESFPPADLEYLQYSNQGLTDLQKRELQNSENALILDFICEKDLLTPTMKKANKLILQLVKDRNAVIYDTETRETFSKDYWQKMRLIDDSTINISQHITIHFYKKEEYCRAITLGMSKFGLPDICIENLSCQAGLDLTGFVNLTSQTLLENQIIKKESLLDLNIDSIKDESLRKTLLSSTFENAEKKAVINLKEGTWEEGDPENRLIEVAFPDSNPQIEQSSVVSKIFGSEDEITTLSHDDEILKASADAKAKIPHLYKLFSNGLSINSSLLLKFPFESSDGQREWMWVEVTKWEDDDIKGLLQNEPYIVKNLKAGQIVSKDIDDMFDYILFKEDGSQEGNETGKIIQKKNN